MSDHRETDNYFIDIARVNVGDRWPEEAQRLIRMGLWEYREYVERTMAKMKKR